MNPIATVRHQPSKGYLLTARLTAGPVPWTRYGASTRTTAFAG